MKREWFFTYKNLGLDPRTNLIVTDDILLTGERAEGATIYDEMQLFHEELMEETQGRTLFVYSALDGECGVACPERFWAGGSVDRLIFPTPKKEHVAEAEMQRMLKELVDALNKEVIAPVMTGIFLEVSKDQWKLVHDLNRDDEVTTGCLHCQGEKD